MLGVFDFVCACWCVVGCYAWPGCEVGPGVVAGEDVVWVECGFFGADVCLVVAVGEGCRPVHEAFWFEGCGVDPVEAWVDVFCDAAADCLVFVGGGVSGGPDPESPAGFLGCVGKGGVREPGVGEAGEVLWEVCGWGEVVDVEGDEASRVDVSFSALAVFEVPCDVSSDVFCVVFFCFWECVVFVCGEGDYVWFVGFCGEVLFCGVGVFPSDGGAFWCCGDCEFAVFHCGSSIQWGLWVKKFPPV